MSRKFNSSWIDRNHYYFETDKGTPEVPHFEARERPVIVCLCGSTRFKDAFLRAQAEETLAGKIVLTVGLFGHLESIRPTRMMIDGCMGLEETVINQVVQTPLDMSSDVKKALDVLHKQKIDLADEVLILNVGGYIGDSTRSELEYAKRHGKAIRFLEEIQEPIPAPVMPAV